MEVGKETWGVWTITPGYVSGKAPAGVMTATFSYGGELAFALRALPSGPWRIYRVRDVYEVLRKKPAPPLVGPVKFTANVWPTSSHFTTYGEQRFAVPVGISSDTLFVVVRGPNYSLPTTAPDEIEVVVNDSGDDFQPLAWWVAWLL